MIVNDEAERRAVAAAIAGAAGQIRLNAGVNITGLLVDIDSASDVDSRQYFMCWHLTSVLAPTLAEVVPSAVVRKVVSKQAVRLRRVAPRPCEPQSAQPVEGTLAGSPGPITVQPPDWLQVMDRHHEKFLWWLNAVQHSVPPVFA